MSHELQLQSPRGQKLLRALRNVCLPLPEVSEVIDGFGHTTFRVGKKSFVIAGMGEDGMAVSIKSDPVTQAALIKTGRFYRTPYIGQHGWVSIDNPRDRDWDDLEELIHDAYRAAAPKRLIRKLEETS
jgi:predicted DNA-binding protein (MmcQ/YjbR family)